MRLKIVIGEKVGSFKIPRDYRKYFIFISFIKSVFTETSRFDEIYGGKKIKPFTFSVFLGDEFEIKEENFKINPPFNFIFSTGDMEIFSHFYNGVLKMKKEGKGLILGKNKIFPVKEIYLEKNLKIKTNCAIFKTIGVCILNNPDESAKNFEKWFITPNSEDIDKFNEILEKRMIEKYERINGRKIQTKITLTPLSDTLLFIRQGRLSESFKDKSIRDVYVKHYNGFLKGFKGIFYLESEPSMLQFIYDYGLGIRTGQGFGLLELIAQI